LLTIVFPFVPGPIEMPKPLLLEESLLVRVLALAPAPRMIPPRGKQGVEPFEWATFWVAL
jgi:hypothetical protein